jgi:hypothetical protein
MGNGRLYFSGMAKSIAPLVHICALVENAWFQVSVRYNRNHETILEHRFHHRHQNGTETHPPGTALPKYALGTHTLEQVPAQYREPITKSSSTTRQILTKQPDDKNKL